MSTLNWKTIRDAVSAETGETPHASLEDDLVGYFEERPDLTVKIRDRILESWRQGKVRSVFAVWRSELARAAANGRDATVQIDDKRELRTRQAETWIRNAGCYVDRENTIRDVEYGPIFGPGGQLHDWRDDQALIDRIAAFWQQHRPRGKRLETEAEAYMAKVKADHQRIKSKEAQ